MTGEMVGPTEHFGTKLALVILGVHHATEVASCQTSGRGLGLQGSYLLGDDVHLGNELMSHYEGTNEHLYLLKSK